MPPPKAVLRRDERIKEFNELEQMLPAEAKEGQSPKKYRAERQGLRKLYEQQGFDFVYWSVRHAAAAGYTNFWAGFWSVTVKYKKGAIVREQETEDGEQRTEGNYRGPPWEREQEDLMQRGRLELEKLSADHREILRKSALSKFPEWFQNAVQGGAPITLNGEIALEEIMVDLVIQYRLSRDWRVRDPVEDWGALMQGWIKSSAEAQRR